MIMSLQKYFIVAGFVPALNLVPDIGNLWLNVRLCGDVQFKKVILQFFFKVLLEVN